MPAEEWARIAQEAKENGLDRGRINDLDSVLFPES